MNLKPVQGLRPFTKFLMTIGELPSSYLVSMTYEEQLLWFCNYLQNTVIPTINNNGEAVEELQNLFIELKDYVDNYFENLDIQEEVNTKLDEMAESGELAELIAEFLDIGVLFVYDTAADLGAAENIKDGAAAYILGKDTYNDGKGAFYKIREITLADVVDGDNIIAITNSDDLVAEKLPNYRLNQIESALDTLTTTTIPGIEGDITTINTTTIPGVLDTVSENYVGIEDYYVILGDSYGTGYGNVTSFITTFKTNMGLDNDHLFTSSMNGIGFVNRPEGNKIFIELLEDLLDTMTSDQKSKITKVIVQGNLNDRGKTKANIVTAIKAFYDYAKAQMPKCNVYLYNVGRSCGNDQNTLINNNVIPAIEEVQKYGVININGAENILHDYSLFQSDGYHPTEDGQAALARFLEEGIKTGYVNPTYNKGKTANLLFNPSGSATAWSNPNLRTQIVNGIASIMTENTLTITLNNISTNAGINNIKIGSIAAKNSDMCVHPRSTYFPIPVTGYISGTIGGSSNGYIPITGSIYFYEDSDFVYDIYIRLFTPGAVTSATSLVLNMFSACSNALWC